MMATDLRILTTLLLLSFFWGCSADPLAEIPPVAEIPEYPVATFDWPWCAVSIPPFRDDLDSCPSTEIGIGITAEQVCRLLVTSKGWLESIPRMYLHLSGPRDLEPSDWDRIESIRVCRYQQGVWQDDGGEYFTWEIRLEVFVPHRNNYLIARLNEESGRIRCHVAGYRGS